MALQVFSQHLLHVLAGLAIVGGLVFGLIGLLVWREKRGTKNSRSVQVGAFQRRGKVPKKRQKRRKGGWK